MARFIDADKLVEHIKDLPTWCELLEVGWRSTKYPNGMFDCEDIINSIKNQPTADVEEVKHGKWKIKRDDYDTQYIKCSVCGEEFFPPDNAFDFDFIPKYCQNCGAKMDGKRVKK